MPFSFLTPGASASPAKWSGRTGVHGLAADNLYEVDMDNLVRNGVALNIFEHCVARFRSVGELHVDENGLAADCFERDCKFLFVDEKVFLAAFAVNDGGDLPAFTVAFCGVAANVCS